MKKTVVLFPSVLVSLLIYSCAAVPTGSRYGDGKSIDTAGNSFITEVTKESVKAKPFAFDFSPYRSWPGITEVPAVNQKRNSGYWYSFEDDSAKSVRVPVKSPGYRILIHTTDEYPEADSVRTAIYLRTNKKAVYLDFESPFYKVKVGDYQSQRQAEDLDFQLNQLGFKNTIVISDSIFVYK